MIQLKQRMGRRLQKGVSLLEVLLSLSIIAIVLIMATRYFLAAKNSALMNDAMSRVTMLQGAVEEYKHANGGTLPSNFAISTIKSSLGNFASDGTLETPWGDAITIESPSTTPKIQVAFANGDSINNCLRLANVISSGTCTESTGILTLNL